MANIFGFTDVWNAAGTVFDCIKCTVTNTASAAGSDLLDLSITGGAQIRFIKTGVLSLSDGTHTGTITPSGTTGLTLSSPTVITGGTVTADTPPLSITQIWNNAGVTFNGIKLNITNTASAAASKLIDLQVGGVSAFNILVNGTLAASASGNSFPASFVRSGGNITLYTYSDAGGSGISSSPNTANSFLYLVPGSGPSAGISLHANNLTLLGGRASDGAVYIGATDCTIFRDAANSLALRNGANAQSLAVYNTFTSASDYERVRLFWAAGTSHIRLEQDGTGNPNGISIGSGGADPLYLETNSTARWQFTGSNGHMLAVTDNVTDIGASGANRPRNIYVGTAVFAGSGFAFLNKGAFRAESDGVLSLLNSGETSFGRLNFGLPTASFPALKRSTTELHVRLADDSADTTLQALTYKVAGTQVVGARVVDARIDDVINSGDATTDGVIDAIVDCLTAHGLIAAA